jgi:ABC-type transport system involved in multi-copper enzyme maturation permease subunit
MCRGNQLFSPDQAALRAAMNTLVVVVPGIIGVFWGAPLIAREFEAGTFRLAWTQGVTRTRWLLVKLGVVGLASMATAGLMSLLVTWWSSQARRQSSKDLTVFFSSGPAEG